MYSCYDPSAAAVVVEVVVWPGSLWMGFSCKSILAGSNSGGSVFFWVNCVQKFRRCVVWCSR